MALMVGQEDGSSVATSVQQELDVKQGGGGVMLWAGIVEDEVVGPFRLEEGVKLTSQTYCQFP